MKTCSPVGELTALPHILQLDLRGLLLRRGKGSEGEKERSTEGREGNEE